MKKLNDTSNELTKALKNNSTQTSINTGSNKKLKESLDKNTASTNKNTTATKNNTNASKKNTAAVNKNTTATNKNTTALKKVTSNVSKDTKATVKNTKAKKTSTKAISSMSKGLLSLVKGFGLIAGLKIFKDIALDAFDLMKTFDRLRFTMEAITTTSFETAESSAFLNDITDRYGLNLVTTTNRFIKFYAAAKQSNITLQKSQSIFESVSKSASVLGLNTQELESTFLALEQMISKGKVSTEELRRQLGERLPGAFGIMAEALDVTLPQLDEMLKKGEVLSAEALPKFAAALEDAYGTESIEKVETLTASQNRLSNAWLNFVKVLSEGSAAKFLQETLDKLSEMVNGVSNLFSDPIQKAQAMSSDVARQISKQIDDELKAEIDSTREAGKKSFELDKKISEARINLRNAITEEEVALEKNKLNLLLAERVKYNKELDELRAEFAEAEVQAAVNELRIAEKKLLDLKKKDEELRNVATASPIAFLNNKLGENSLSKELDAQIKLVAKLKGEIIVLNKAIDKVKPVEVIPLENEEEKKPKYKVDTSDLDLRISKLKIMADALNEIRKDELRDLDTRLSANKQYAEILSEIEQLSGEKKVRLAKGNANKLEQIEQETNYSLINIHEERGKDASDISLKFIKERTKKIRDALDNEMNEKILAIKKEYSEIKDITAEQEKELNEEIQDIRREYSNRSNQDQADFIRDQLDRLEIFGEERVELERLITKLLSEIEVERDTESIERQKHWINESIELIHEFVNSVADIYDALLDRRIENIDAEIDAETRKYDKLIELADDDAQQQAALEEEKEKRLEKLRAKRLKAEQQQAKFQKALAIADIAVKLGQTIVNHNLAAAAIDATTLGIGGKFYKAIQIPLSIAIAAAQTASVLASPIPKFKMGVENLRSDTKAIINDGGQQEFVEREGNILTTDVKNAMVDLKQGDTVYRNYEHMMSKSKLIDNVNNSIPNNIIKIDSKEQDIEGSIIRGFKKAKIENNITVKTRDAEQDAYRKSLSSWGQ